jgi:hypothetical protein
MFIQYSPSSSYSLCVIHLNSYSCHSANSVIIQFIQSSSILLQYRPVYYSLRPSSYSHPPVFAPVHTVFIVQSTTVFAQFRQSVYSSEFIQSSPQSSPSSYSHHPFYYSIVQSSSSLLPSSPQFIQFSSSSLLQSSPSSDSLHRPVQTVCIFI